MIRLIFFGMIVGTIVLACLPVPPELPGMPPGPIQHVVAFVVLTILATRAFPEVRGRTIFVALAILGGLIEVLQAIPQIDRQASLQDWLVDCGAILAALMLTTVGRSLRRPGDLAD